MRALKTLLLPCLAILLSSSLFAPSAFAELVTFNFTGRTQATIDGTFFSDVAFEVTSTINDTAADQFPFQNNRGAFSGATTTLSIPSAGIFDAVSTNVTGIFQETFGSSRLRLVDPNNFFGQAALGVNLPSGAIPDGDSLNPLNGPLPTLNSFEGGLQWQFLLGPNVTFNSGLEVTVTNVSATATAGVPEPTSFTMFAMGMLAVSLKRRRR